MQQSLTLMQVMRSYRGAPVHLVKQTLGHASIATTGLYLHARPSDSSSAGGRK